MLNLPVPGEFGLRLTPSSLIFVAIHSASTERGSTADETDFEFKLLVALISMTFITVPRAILQRGLLQCYGLR
jgi:hypothetical protein